MRNIVCPVKTGNHFHISGPLNHFCIWSIWYIIDRYYKNPLYSPMDSVSFIFQTSVLMYIKCGQNVKYFLKLEPQPYEFLTCVSSGYLQKRRCLDKDHIISYFHVHFVYGHLDFSFCIGYNCDHTHWRHPCQLNRYIFFI